MKGIPGWSTLAAGVALAALTGLGFDAKPAMARTDSQNYQNRGSGSTRHSDQRDAQDYGNHQRSWDSSDQDRGGRGDGYRGSRDGQRDQGGQWGNRDGGQQCQGRRSHRGSHGSRSYGHGARNTSWRDQDYGRNRGGCNN